MELFFSSEVDQSALLGNHETEQLVKPLLEAAVAREPLASLDVKIRYIPIIMTEENRARYPARSRVKHKERIFNCCPQLDIQPFLTGSKTERIKTFLSGLRECGPALKKLGATTEQIGAFDRILDETLKKLTGA